MSVQELTIPLLQKFIIIIIIIIIIVTGSWLCFRKYY